ncbi:MAG: hypothetical protein ACE5FY_00330 [Nitrospiria bacterium]
MSDNENMIKILREKNYHFRTLEKDHQAYETSLESLRRIKVLSAEEERQEKNFQKKKLAAKDSMEEIIRQYKANGDAGLKTG